MEVPPRNSQAHRPESPSQGIEITNIMNLRSMAKDLSDTEKGILITCVSVGCTVDGKHPKDLQQEITDGDWKSPSTEFGEFWKTHYICRAMGRSRWSHGVIWDDGVYSTVRQLEITHGAELVSIRIDYDRSGASVWSKKHGGNTRAKIDKGIPNDVIVEVGEANFSLHKFMLIAKSNYIRKLIIESKEADLARINLSNIAGGPEIFEKAAKFYYGVNFEITVHNVAALRCATEYLQMTDIFCDNNLCGRTENFLSQVSLSSLSGTLVILKSCEDLLPMVEDLKILFELFFSFHWIACMCVFPSPGETTSR